MAVFEYEDDGWLREVRNADGMKASLPTDEKARVCVNDESEVPDGYEFHEGPRGSHR